MHKRATETVFCLMVSVLLAFTCVTAHAAKYYVRTDGGTATQCTGTTDAAYPGSGNGKACAYNSPYWAFSPGVPTGPTKLAAGDTLYIHSGSYMIGYGAPNTPTNYCQPPATYQCEIYVPSGIDASHPTTITGDCSAPPELWGTQANYTIFRLQNVHDVKLACMELTDHSMCIDGYQPTSNTGGVTACIKSYPYGAWTDQGIFASNVKNLTLDSLNIHGFALQGVNAGLLSGNTNVSNVTIRGNGLAGWNGDLGGGGSSNSGNLTFTNLTVAWNGCAEAYPATTIVGCWGQNEGGYGDGFSEAGTGGIWVFSNSQFISNTQDGLDMLYADGTGSITMDRLFASQNAGNQIKTAGPATLTNSIAVGYCNNWAGFPIAGNNSSGVSGTMCRADGTAVVMEFAKASGETVTLAYNTITGDGDTLFIGGGGDAGISPTSSDVVQMLNNIWLGQTSVIPRDGGAPTALDWYSDGTYNGKVIYTNNVIWNVRNNNCPATSICKDPQLTNETLAGFWANPLSSSPALGNANRSAYSVAWDFYGSPRSATGPLDIGAVAYRGQPYLSSGGGDSPVPPANGGTKSASEAPVAATGPTQPVQPPRSVGTGEGRIGALRDREGLGADRSLRWRFAGVFAGWWGVRSTQSTRVPGAQASQPVAATVRVVPVTAAAQSAAEPGQAPSVQRSYFVVVYDWFAGVYDKYRNLFWR